MDDGVGNLPAEQEGRSQGVLRMRLDLPFFNCLGFGRDLAEGLLRRREIPPRLNGDGAPDTAQEGSVDVRDRRRQLAGHAVRRIRLGKPVQLSVHASDSQMSCDGVRLPQPFIGDTKEGLKHIECVFETELVFQIMGVGEHRGDHDARILVLKRVGHGPHEAGEMARLGAVVGELAAHALGGRVLIAKHVGMRGPATGAEQVDEAQREKRRVAEPRVGRGRGASTRETPEEHRVRQTVPFHTRLRHRWPPSLRSHGVPPLPPPRSAARTHLPFPNQVIASPARSKHPATHRAGARRHHATVAGSTAGVSPCR